MYVLIFALLLGLVPAAIAHSKGGNFFLWWLYGAAIWIVAFPHALIMRADAQALESKALAAGQKKCPDCAELIRQEAVVCRHCGLKLPVVAATNSPLVLQPVANSSGDAVSGDLETAKPPITAQDNTERIVLGVAAAFLLFIFVFFLVALNPASPERRVVGRTVGNTTQTGNTATSPETVSPTAPPRGADRAASQAVATSNCSVIDRHGFIAFLACPSGMRPADWRAEGIKACGTRRVCNAWIWESRRHAATSLPMTDAQVNAAVAIWQNASQNLMNCRTTGC